ncbi:MAG TPA: FAD-dependent monooxygenase [Gemmataceae bacterium]|jgi:flavin-dependent dehydrogenase|nr:FAD-dependent monooxygenase [Gemmataceae bacterium]
MTTDFDAAIVVAGPAGAAAAIALTRLGRRVLLVDAASNPYRKIGESLPGAARPLLLDLGVLPQFLAGDHRPCYGNVAFWGSERPTVHDFLFDPHGHGWHLDRACFDRMLLDGAREAGAEVRLGAPFRSVNSAEDGTRVVSFEGTNGTYSCRWMLDATGRRSLVSRQFGALRRRHDQLVAIHASFRVQNDGDDRTWIEACPDGWWYSADIPGSRRVAAFFTDVNIGAKTLRNRSAFLDKLHSTQHLRSPFARSEMDSEPHWTDAATTILEQAVGEGWCAVGDAAIAFDPLCSQGLFSALYTGLRAAQAVDTALDGSTSALESYAERLKEIATQYHRNLAYCYAQERRWNDSPFWRCRHQLDLQHR